MDRLHMSIHDRLHDVMGEESPNRILSDDMCAAFLTILLALGINPNTPAFRQDSPSTLNKQPTPEELGRVALVHGPVVLG